MISFFSKTSVKMRVMLHWQSIIMVKTNVMCRDSSDSFWFSGSSVNSCHMRRKERMEVFIGRNMVY